MSVLEFRLAQLGIDRRLDGTKIRSAEVGRREVHVCETEALPIEYGVLEVRVDEFPSGRFSDNHVTTPVPAADALTTILPLVMHERPDAVMLMGDDIGVGIQMSQRS